MRRYSRKLLVEKWMRDAKISDIYDVSPESRAVRA